MTDDKSSTKKSAARDWYENWSSKAQRWSVCGTEFWDFEITSVLICQLWDNNWYPRTIRWRLECSQMGNLYHEFCSWCFSDPSGYYWFIFLTSAPTIRVVYLSYLLRPSTTFSCNYTAAVAPLCWNETESRFSKLPKMILAKKHRKTTELTKIFE